MEINGLEIKKIRKKLGLTQKKFAEKLGVSEKTIQNYEAGRKIPKTKQELLRVSLNEIKKEKGQVTESADIYNTYNKSVMYVPIVNKFAYAGYLNGGFGDDEYIEELPKIPFTNDIEPKGEYMCFEVKGDSMDDGSYEAYLEGDILLCRNIRPDYWLSKLHIDKWDFVVVHKELGILVKRIIEHKVSEGIITLHSLNDYYEDIDVHLQDVQKLFNIVDFRRKRNRR